MAWASWNYLIDESISGTKTGDKQTDVNTKTPAKPVLTYHMNILQRLTKKHNYLVTLNHDIDDQQIIKSIDYSHPVFDLTMVDAQTKW
ncbi:hypothetical protein R0K20_17315, partial [Staphylococcus sp. SIMBA_130]